MTHHTRGITVVRWPWHGEGSMVRTALRTYLPHVVVPSLSDEAILWVGRNVLRLRPREAPASAILQLQLLDLMFCVPFVWAILVSWLGPNKHAEPPETLWTAILMFFAVARFIIHVAVRMRSAPADDAFCEEADVEFVTKACDAATLAEAVFLLSSFLRMTPATAFAFLFAMLNYHQIRLWRSQFRRTQGAALWVGGLTWEVLMLSFVALLAAFVPLDWQAMEELRTASYGWHDHVRRMFDQYEWLTRMSISLVGAVSGFILLFQTATTLIDLGRMLRTVENEPGLRRKSVHQTVGRLLVAAVIPNMAFNSVVGFWILPVVEWPCVTPVPAAVFLMIFFGHTATVLQIMYDRITCGRYGMVYASDIAIVALCAAWRLTCVPMEGVAVCVCFFIAFWVWLSGVKVLAVREAPL
jgi:hypothetical protein